MRRKVIALLSITWLIPGLIAGADRGKRARPQPASLVRASTMPTVGTAPVTPSHRPVEVSRISIQNGSAGEARVDVATTEPAAYRVLRLKNPDRLVLDVEDARNATHQKVYPVESPLLKGVRVGQFRDKSPAVVRVVADLLADAVFDVHSYQGGVRIELRSRARAAKLEVPHAAPSVPVAQISPPPPKAEETSARLAPVSSPAEQPAKTDKPATAAVEAHAVAPKIPSADSGITAPPASDYQNALPAEAGSKEVTAAPRPVPPEQAPEALQTAKAAKIVAGSTPVVAAAVQGQTPAGAAEKPKYSGEPISLNLKDVDLKDFFRLIHEISGLNIIVDPNVTGSVTMVLDAVPWDQALDIVLKNNRLDKTLEGNVLRIAKVETLAAEQDATSKLAAARDAAQPLVTVFRPVNYAKATTIQTMLKSWVGGGALTGRGTILVDDRTNTLIVSDIQSQIPVIDSIVSKLDTRAKQVAIEARIILATASFSRSLQAALSGGSVNKSASVVTGGATGTGAQVTPNIVPPPRITIGQTSAGGFGAFAVSNASSRYFLNAAIAAAETKSQAKTISRPTIITQNNVAGSVQQGSQIPIQTTINNTISIQYINATLQLSVTPQVTEDGNIFLQINVQNSSPGPALTIAGPSINTQSATTQVMVPDGGTVVFGGVTVTSRTRSATYVPLIGSIPIVGHLFKTSNVQDSDNELLFFVSPKVLPG